MQHQKKEKKAMSVQTFKKSHNTMFTTTKTWGNEIVKTMKEQQDSNCGDSKAKGQLDYGDSKRTVVIVETARAASRL